MILSFKADPSLMAALESEVAARNAEKKGVRHSRSSVVMQLLWEALDASTKKRK